MDLNDKRFLLDAPLVSRIKGAKVAQQGAKVASLQLYKGAIMGQKGRFCAWHMSCTFTDREFSFKEE